MDRVIMWIMSLGIVLGGIDRILGNRFGLGKRFEDAFRVMGDIALSMAGIICFTPLLSRFISAAVGPLCGLLNIDPSIFAGVIAIDMGGYQLAVDMAKNPLVGNFSGVVIASTLGCAITFTIPVGMGMVMKEDRQAFARGILFGLIAVPAALIFGGLLCGLSLGAILWQSLPMLLVSALLLLGIWKCTDKMIRGFSMFAAGIRIISTIGLIAAAFQYMTGFALIPGLAPIQEAMAIVASIAIAMLGSLPISELLQRLLKRPMAWFGERTGMNSASVTGLLIGIVSVTMGIVLIKDMDKRGKVVIAAYLVCAASGFAAHLGFVAGMNSSLIAPLLVSKVVGGAVGAAIALWGTRGKAKSAA